MSETENSPVMPVMSALPQPPDVVVGPYRIGPWMMAPMAGYSDPPFREIVREMGAGLTTTELISSEGILHAWHKQKADCLPAKNEVPFSLQLFGADAEHIAEAAARVVGECGVQMIDINMGCPVPKVVKKGGGASLMQQPELAAAMVTAVRRRVDVPVTVKFRAGWDEGSKNCIEFARRLEDAGAAALALHARTRAQYHKGKADWNLIRALKEVARVPVFGNGDALDAASARRMWQETGCDGVMIGRGAISNPWVFADLTGRREVGPVRASERLPVVLRHLTSHLAFVGDEVRALRAFRTKLMQYAKGLPGAAQFREQVCEIENEAAIRALIEEFFSRAEMSLEEQYRVADETSLDWATPTDA